MEIKYCSPAEIKALRDRSTTSEWLKYTQDAIALGNVTPLPYNTVALIDDVVYVEKWQHPVTR